MLLNRVRGPPAAAKKKEQSQPPRQLADCCSPYTVACKSLRGVIAGDASSGACRRLLLQAAVVVVRVHVRVCIVCGPQFWALQKKISTRRPLDRSVWLFFCSPLLSLPLCLCVCKRHRDEDGDRRLGTLGTAGELTQRSGGVTPELHQQGDRDRWVRITARRPVVCRVPAHKDRCRVQRGRGNMFAD